MRPKYREPALASQSVWMVEGVYNRLLIWVFTVAVTIRTCEVRAPWKWSTNGVHEPVPYFDGHSLWTRFTEGVHVLGVHVLFCPIPDQYMDKFGFFPYKMKRWVQFFIMFFFLYPFITKFSKKQLFLQLFTRHFCLGVWWLLFDHETGNKMAGSRTFLFLLFSLFLLFVIPEVFSDVCAPPNKDVKALKS